jgi:hypothetical protein
MVQTCGLRDTVFMTGFRPCFRYRLHTPCGAIRHVMCDGTDYALRKNWRARLPGLMLMLRAVARRVGEDWRVGRDRS